MSITDALVSVNPPLLKLMVEELKAIKGEVEIVDEGEIRRALSSLLKKGFFVEPKFRCCLCSLQETTR